MVIGATWRTIDGRARVSYRPDWDSTLPFIIYVRGTARVHRGSLVAASHWLRQRENAALDVTSKPT